MFLIPGQLGETSSGDDLLDLGQDGLAHAPLACKRETGAMWTRECIFMIACFVSL